MTETVPSGTILYERYRIERVLGSGGFGHVYLAIDVTTNQSYAVKEYLVTGESGQEQLQHEASVLSHLRHPSLPAFQDAFIERGRYYVVINYIEGSDLTDLIRMVRQHNEVIPIAQIIGWMLAICDAVNFLHQQQPAIIHRDIKPDNIRITSSGTAVLVDLGNAKAAADGARTLLFIRHQGTPGYAPPEQYPGGSGTDTRSDTYALGATLYFALTAHEPPSVSVRNQSRQQGRPTLPSLRECLANNPPEESAQANAGRQFRLGVSKPGKPQLRHSYHVAQLGALSPQLLAQLNAVIQKAMELAPKDRYPTIADLAHELQQIAQSLPMPPSPSSNPHATQPDLDEVHQAVQAQDVKGLASQAGQPFGGNASSGQQATMNCYHCGAASVANAAFCPRCGIASVRPANVRQMAKMNISDVSAEETLLMKPSQFSQAVAVRLAKPPMTNTPDALPFPPIGVGPPKSIPITQSSLQDSQFGQDSVDPSQSPFPQEKGQSALLSYFKIGRGMIFFLVLLLILFIALIVALLVTMRHV